MGATPRYTRAGLYSRLATHLQRRGRVWHYRRRVPKGLRHLLPREITRSLATGSIGLARKRARLLDDQVAVLFVALRSQKVTPEDVDQLINELVDSYVEWLVSANRRNRWRDQDLWEAARANDAWLEDVTEALESSEEWALRRHDFQAEAEEVVKAAGVELDPKAQSRLAWELRNYWEKTQRLLAKERWRDYRGQPRMAIEAILRRTPQRPAPTHPEGRRQRLGPSLGQAIEDYLKEESRTWTPRHRVNIASYLRSLAVHVGAAKPATSVTKAEVIAWREELRRSRSETTVRKYVASAVRFFRFAEEAEWIESSPAERLPGGVAAKDTRRPDELRQAVSDADLEAIVGGPRFAQLRHGSARDRETFWAVLLLVYTGARRGEVAQAWVSDVAEVDGVWCLRIEPSDEPGAEKSVKTAAGRRAVPLHADLVELGLLDYVEDRRATGERRLFPGSVAQGGDRLSRVWQSLREEAGLGRDVVLHGLRHRVTTQLKHAGVDEVRIAELVGHANASITMGRYGKAYPVEALREAAARIRNRGPLARLFS